MMTVTATTGAFAPARVRPGTRSFGAFQSLSARTVA
ncbi:hypothetical protein MIPYR_10564 [uncultured Microbacterium sp.]|uniref:Uncharacterized protein n=1 Tax=uncultured Microbacterium sp. TaxID=191216 RepID=A0A1Y5NW49_9MICO|nr:hypothetical protein MIPYR_10564 [uncultured Microbacterium sp.]